MMVIVVLGQSGAAEAKYFRGALRAVQAGDIRWPTRLRNKPLHQIPPLYVPGRRVHTDSEASLGITGSGIQPSVSKEYQTPNAVRHSTLLL